MKKIYPPSLNDDSGWDILHTQRCERCEAREVEMERLRANNARLQADLETTLAEMERDAKEIDFLHSKIDRLQAKLAVKQAEVDTLQLRERELEEDFAAEMSRDAALREKVRGWAKDLQWADGLCVTVAQMREAAGDE